MAELKKRHVYRALNKLGWKESITVDEILASIDPRVQLDYELPGPREQLEIILLSLAGDRDRLCKTWHRDTKITGLRDGRSVTLDEASPRFCETTMDTMVAIVLGLAALYSVLAPKANTWNNLAGALTTSVLSFVGIVLASMCWSRLRRAYVAGSRLTFFELKLICYLALSVFSVIVGGITNYLMIRAT